MHMTTITYRTRIALWFAFIPPLTFIAAMQIAGVLPTGVLT